MLVHPSSTYGSDLTCGCRCDERLNVSLKKRPINECRCDERLKTKSEESTRLTYTGLFGEQEHLKIKTRFINEKFASVMGEY
jgi:hypothetical protein